MKLHHSLMLMEHFAECPKCGSASIGNGQGKLQIDQNYFFRSCKCGWSVYVAIEEDAE